MLLLSITGIYSAFKLDVNVATTGAFSTVHLASDMPTGTDTVNMFMIGVKAGTDCAVAYSEDPNFPSDYVYNKCLDDHCAAANSDWANIKEFDRVPLTWIACYRTCSPLATAGNALKHKTCLKAGLDKAGVASTELMQDYVVLGPVSLTYEGNIAQTEPLKFNSYGRYMRDLEQCGAHGADLWEGSKQVANTGRVFRLVHAAKVKKMKDDSICSSVLKASASIDTELDLKAAHDCLLKAAKIAFPADAAWITCAADAALPVTGGQFELGKIYVPDGEQTFNQKDKGGKLEAHYSSWASCIGALAGTAFNYAEVY